MKSEKIAGKATLWPQLMEHKDTGSVFLMLSDWSGTCVCSKGDVRLGEKANFSNYKGILKLFTGSITLSN